MLALHLAGAKALLLGCSDLSKVDRDNREWLATMVDRNQLSSVSLHKCLVQCISNLLGEADNSCVLTGKYMVEADEIRKHSGKHANGSALTIIRIWKGFLCCIFNNFLCAEEALEATESNYVFVITRSFLWYCYGLALLSLSRHSHGWQKLVRTQRGCRQLALLRKVARFNPFLMHRVYLLEALLLLCQGSSNLAHSKFEASIEWARHFKNPCDEAVANEHAGIALFEQGLESEGRQYIQEAIIIFERWGAMAKVDQLRSNFGF